MSDYLPLLPTANTDAEKALKEAKLAIEAAIQLIIDQEDGPVTMRAVLKEAIDRIDTADTEVWLLKGDLLTATEINAKLRDQLGETAHQRDILLRWYMALIRGRCR
jgi:hypothetical protein